MLAGHHVSPLDEDDLVEHDHVALFEMGAHPFLTLTLFIAMFERDHPEPLSYQKAYGAALGVDSATLRSRSASVLGYTNNALTDERRRAVFATVLTHAARGAITVTHDVIGLDDVPAVWAEVASGRAPQRVVVSP